MKHFLKNKGKRLTAAVLSAVMCLMALPMSAFAFTAEEGKSVEAYYGSYYLGSDGEYYRSADYNFIAYDSNGNTSLHAHDGGGKRAKLMIRDGSGERQLMCIESGVDYNAGGSYESTSGKNSSYFQNLPASAQYGIMLTSLYGWQPGRTAPIGGTNEDDFSIATQTIMWEYQQQLRTSPTTLQANSYGIPADTYFSMIQGRPAESCYNWILSQMKTHSTVPSFTSNQAGSAQTYTLKYNQAQDNYSLTLTDTNNLLTDIHFTSDKGITVTRNGNEYTFTSKKMIENAVSLSAQKNIPTVAGNLLIWGYPGKQTMVSGAEDPVYFYMNIKTETTGIGHIVKHSEDGKVDGIRFTISGNGVNKTVTTKADGTVDIELMPGVYTVTEENIEKYEPQKVQRVTIVSGGTSAVTFSNTLKRGDVQVIKSSEDNFVEGVTFHLYGTSLSGIAVDEYAVTDKNGVATFKNVLISGKTPYTLEEVDTAIRYVIPEKQTAPVLWKEVTSRSFTNILKKYLYITVSHKTVDEMAAQYGFNQEQKDYLAELLKDENNSMWSAVLYGISYSDGEIVTVALSQVGNMGGEPYWSWYGFNSRVEWCACFVSWCANECGYIDTWVIPKFAGCVNGSQWFKDRGQWQDGSVEPVPGMIIFFDWESDGETDHVGIVEKVENGTVYTVEGNSGDACRQRSYPVGSSSIYGYGIPAY